MLQDRVGLAWRGELAAGILSDIAQIDVLEVLADPLRVASRADVAAIESLARERPLYLHGTRMGLAASAPVPEQEITAMARLVERIKPAGWSEHLALVRAGGHDTGHLTAPPRTRRNIDGSVRNVERATRVVGLLPALENVATLVEPPAVGYDEAGWLTEILTATNGPWLLDLHNLYANSLNRGAVPLTEMYRLPLDRVQLVHLAGGQWLERDGRAARSEQTAFRLLDDHLHAVPDPVFQLLTALAAAVPQPLTVLIERDGRFPAMNVLLAEISTARAALARGRRQRTLMASAA
jgi:uncharacterized protein